MKTWPILISALWVLTGCQDRDALIGEPVPNTPPDTEITATPPILDRTDSAVRFYWRGIDADGEVVAFDWRMSDNGRDGIVDIADTLESRLPWHRTTATDSTFFVSADVDSFPDDVEDPKLEHGEYRFWQTHTLFVRAMDDDGAIDPTPASVSFTATTLAPTVVIDVPPVRPGNTCNTSALALTFGWRASDPDGPKRRPEAVRWIMLPFGSPSGEGCAMLSDFEAIQPIRNDNPLWSDWIAYDAPLDSGRTVTLPKQLPNQRFLFAVQARDVSGAVTATFDWNHNVRYVQTSVGVLPVLWVRSNLGSEHTFVGTREFVVLDAIADQPLTFQWEGDAAYYAGIIEAYRYGWNVADLTDPEDPGWAVEWGDGPLWQRAGPQAFSGGSPNLVIQCRDNSGTVSQAFFQFRLSTYLERSKQRNLLIIDDFPNANTSSQIALDKIWDDRWIDFFLNRVQGFGRTDMIDAQHEPRRVRFDTIGEYKAVIWFTSVNENSFLRQKIAGLGPELHWLEIYQARVGNMLLCGPGAMYGSLKGIFDTYPVLLSRSGRLRWPFDAWCIDAVSVVRPPSLDIYGEAPGHPRRSKQCDNLIVARAAPDFLDTYPSARGMVRDLQPAQEREVPDPEYDLEWEEFYNTNATNLHVTLVPRRCQTPMFLHRARRDEGRVEKPDLVCYPLGWESSTINLAPVGIVSRAYVDSKPLVGSEDFLWGFHPMAFDDQDVRDALLWIAQERWQLPVR